MVGKFVIVSLSYCHNLSPFSLMPPVPHAVQVGGCHICHRNCQNCQNRTVIFCCHFFPFSHLQHSPWHAPSPSCCASYPAQSSPSDQGGSSPVTWSRIIFKKDRLMQNDFWLQYQLIWTTFKDVRYSPKKKQNFFFEVCL